MKLFTYSLTAILLLSPVCLRAQDDAPQDGPDKLVLKDLLKSGSYDIIMQKLDSLTQILEEDKTQETYYWRAFNTFDISDPSIEENLNDWIEQYPDCSNAYAARAQYYMRAGWDIRGYGWAKDVGEDQWEGMREYFKKALVDAAEGLKIDPRNLACYSVTISISMNIADNSVTRRFFDEALKVDPGSLGIWTGYMWTLQTRWGGTHEEMDQLADESDQYDSLNPKLKVLHGFASFDEGRGLEDSGDYESAISRFNDAISFGENSDFYHDRGNCRYSLKKYQEALDDYNQALQLSPQNTTYLSSKAYALQALGDLDEARATIDYGLEISPTDKILLSAKEFLNSKKSEGYDHAKKGYDLLEAGDYEKAISEYNQAINKDPSDYVTYYNRGVCYEKLQRYDEAISDFQKATFYNSKYADAYYNLGVIHGEQGRYEEAVSDYTWMINAKPDDYVGYVNRSYCLHQLGRNEEGLDDLKRACELGYQKACDSYNAMKGQ